MSEKTERHLDTFWELIDEVLNAVLFLLIGLEVLIVTFELPALLAGLAAIPLVLLARLVAVGVPVMAYVVVVFSNLFQGLTVKRFLGTAAP
ncbi:hypothetical protein [Marinobacter antarcticus]|uniref:hypothetical protein n=1 Tax=Marinobacter antarcticus TaxID=564117 RepID=UPI0009322627|nr:hypothetical protein [Marinobacter antarcticus]